MVIRSQDKHILVNTSDFILGADPSGKIFLFSGRKEDEKYVLGRYETKDRAIEILDRIEHYHIVGGKNFVYDMPDE